MCAYIKLGANDVEKQRHECRQPAGHGQSDVDLDRQAKVVRHDERSLVDILTREICCAVRPDIFDGGGEQDAVAHDLGAGPRAGVALLADDADDNLLDDAHGDDAKCLRWPWG